MDSEQFAKLPPTKLFFKCAVPAVVTSVFGALYSVVDGVFVGRYLGEDALAAINFIMPILMIVAAISNMIATGASVNMSILLGKGEREEASRVFSFSVKFIFAFSLVVSALGFFLARPFVLLIARGATAEAIDCSVEYLKIFALFGPLVPIYFATDNFLRVCGKERRSMTIGVVTQILNVILDFLLIAVFRQGVWAAAVASCASIVLGSVVTFSMFLGRRMDVYYTRKGVPISRFFRLVANGFSEFFSTVSVSVMSVVMNLFLLKYGGTTAVAAFSIVMYVDSIMGMLNFGICDALQPAISYCYGAGLRERMKAIFKRVVAAAAATSFAAFLFMLFAGPHVATAFIRPDDTELLGVSVRAIKIFSFSYIVGWIDMCFSSFFTALERPVRSLVVSLFGTLVFPVAFLFILTAFLALDGVWLMANAAALSSGTLTLILAKTLQIDKPRLHKEAGNA